MRAQELFAVFLTFGLAMTARAQEVSIPIEGEVPAGPETHFFLPFEVPEGIAEIEVRHDDLSAVNVLDWGLDDPDGFRGWGGGKSEPGIVGLEAASPSYVPGPIPAGVWEVVVGKVRVDELPALYAVEVILRTEATLAPQEDREPYTPALPLEDGPRWYAGDFHAHTVESDGTPTPDELVSLAETTGLDFVMLSEHNTVSQLSWYAQLQADHPDVLLIPGNEFTTYAGHANAIGTTQWLDHRIGVRGATIEDAIADTHAQGGLFSINHPLVEVPNLCAGCGWQYEVDPRTIDGVEVLNSALFSGVAFWEELLDGGSHAAAIGGSDDHDGGAGSDIFYAPLGTPTTLVYADNLSVEAVLQGIRDGRTVVKFVGPDGPMIETELSGERIGDTVFADEATLRATVTGGLGARLQVVRNGDVLADAEITADPFVHEVAVGAPASGEDRYRHQVVQERNSQVLSLASHVFLPEPGPAAQGLGALSALWVLARVQRGRRAGTRRQSFQRVAHNP